MSSSETALAKQFKLTEERAPSGKKVRMLRGFSVSTLMPPFLRFLASAKSTLREIKNCQPHDIPEHYIGINIAPGDSPEADEYIIERLKELGLQSVRIDFGYGEESQVHAGRLIPRLHEEGFRILLHLVQPVDEAWAMDSPRNSSDARQKWESFIDETLTRFSGMIENVEPAGTVNRFSWSGYTIRGYLAAATVGAEVCKKHDIPWLGPNVSDFSPIYNVGVLSRLKSRGLEPQAHTNNLFVDRAGQPENNDSKVLNKISDHLDFDLVEKARFLRAISRHFEIPETMSTYSYWTLDIKSKSKPRYVTEEQFARYLVRYIVLTAVSGHLDRVYWGQMISHAKGLIGDNTGIKPRIPAVHHCWRIFGDHTEYVIRPGFHAMAAISQTIQGTRFLRRLKTNNNVFAFEFEKYNEQDDEKIIVSWTRDHFCDSLQNWFASGKQEIVSVHDQYGKSLSSELVNISQDPIIIRYRGVPITAEENEDRCGYLGRILMPKSEDSYYLFSNEEYRGILRQDLHTESFEEILKNPETLLKNESANVIKNSSRSLLVEMAIETANGPKSFYFKKFRKQKKFGSKKRSRAFKTWNNITECQYRGIKTPSPFMLMENSDNPALTPCYLLVETAVDTITARTIFDKIRKNSELPIGLSKDDFLEQFGKFTRSMHKAGIYHRDYTGGNILVSLTPENGKVEFSIIDLSRARFYRRVKLRKRLMDLSRVRLSLEDRRKFFEGYRYHKKHFERDWLLYRLVHLFYRTKYVLKKPSRLLKMLKKSASITVPGLYASFAEFETALSMFMSCGG